ncbi:biotin--[acetyl-CoA-carboxylase] ligase [Phycisphaerales bacterium AB-hyl4]|uniref:biotin--[biotin carboxyl-carrier protein] ligase n=1 Tax=Natronomicrosphaera hydrolytica TaxID=3242702 RepID=A0ABV4U448_9BACT
MRSIHHDTLDSTSDEARRMLSCHPGEVLLITAGQQTRGRGRRGRTWHSPRGGVWLSLAWPTKREPTHYTAAPLIAALATWHTLMGCIGDHEAKREAQLRIKWPNDLLLDGRKLAGILCEQAMEHSALIVGVGVNANFAASDLPTNVRQPTTTLRDALGHAVDLPAFTNRLAQALEAALADLERDGFTDDTRLAIEQRLTMLGQCIALRAADRVVQGNVQGLAPDGGLLLDVAGEQQVFTVGEVQQTQQA